VADTLAEAYRRIQQLEQQPAAAGEELDQLAYGISHELRSPLRAVGGFAQMLEEDCAGPRSVRTVAATAE
jgi:signal transduction histidine kinase